MNCLRLSVCMRTHAVSAIHVIGGNAIKPFMSRFSAKERKLYCVKENIKVGKIRIPVVHLRRNLGLIESEKDE